MNPLFRLKLDYISRIPMLTVEEFRTLPTSELEARPSALAIPVFGPPREIAMCQGIQAFPDIPLTVQEFSPEEGDVVYKTWTNKDGEVRKADLRPFAIADPKATSAQYRAILKEHWTKWARAKTEEQYRLLAELYLSEQTTSQGRALLEDFGPFALAYTLKMGSAWISSPDKLDMEPVVEQGYPLHGKVALPSIVKAQFDALSSLLMTTLQRGVEKGLETLDGAADWEVFFVVVAVLADIVSRMRTDRVRHAKQRGIQSLFTEPESVEMAEEGLNGILGRFHQLQAGVDVAHLLESSNPGVKELYLAVKGMDASPDFSPGWWLRQLTEKDWEPRPTYRAD